MNGRHPGYRFSKVLLNAMTRIFNDEIDNDNVKVNTMCPGSVDTDMTRGAGLKAPKTPEEAADTAIWLATLPADGPRGLFFRNRELMDW